MSMTTNISHRLRTSGERCVSCVSLKSGRRQGRVAPRRQTKSKMLMVILLTVDCRKEERAAGPMDRIGGCHYGFKAKQVQLILTVTMS